MLPCVCSYKASCATSNVENYKWRLNPVWHRMLYVHMATVGVKGIYSAKCFNKPEWITGQHWSLYKTPDARYTWCVYSPSTTFSDCGWPICKILLAAVPLSFYRPYFSVKNSCTSRTTTIMVQHWATSHPWTDWLAIYHPHTVTHPSTNLAWRWDKTDPLTTKCIDYN